jgi:hypothetical protein
LVTNIIRWLNCVNYSISTSETVYGRWGKAHLDKQNICSKIRAYSLF